MIVRPSWKIAFMHVPAIAVALAPDVATIAGTRLPTTNHVITARIPSLADASPSRMSACLSKSRLKPVNGLIRLRSKRTA